jgi:hypothetical protein
VRDAPPRECAPSWARLRRSSRTGTIIESSSGYDVGELYGCLRARGAQVPLTHETWFSRSLRLAGPYAAIAGFDCGPEGDCDSTFVSVTDLRDEDSRFSRSARAGPKRAVQVAALRMRGDGGAAWVACATSFSAKEPGEDDADPACRMPGRMTKWVYVWGAHARTPRLVASSRSIDARTLRVRGRDVMWRQGSRTRSVRMS